MRLELRSCLKFEDKMDDPDRLERVKYLNNWSKWTVQIMVEIGQECQLSLLSTCVRTGCGLDCSLYWSQFRLRFLQSYFKLEFHGHTACFCQPASALIWVHLLLNLEMRFAYYGCKCKQFEPKLQRNKGYTSCNNMTCISRIFPSVTSVCDSLNYNTPSSLSLKPCSTRSSS